MPNRNNHPQQLDAALIEQHRHLVPAIARRYASCCPEPLEDLIQEGLIGLLQAAQRYDRKQDVPFAAFARLHIRGAILHHLRDRLWCVRLPRRQAELLWRGIVATTAAGQGQQQANHWVQQPVQYRGQQRQQSLELLQRWQRLIRPVSIEGLVEEKGLSAWDQEIDPESPGLCSEAWEPDSLHPSWMGRSSAEMLASLEPLQRQVVRAVVLEGHSYRRAGHALGISAATVQRNLHKGLALLRERLSCSALNPLAG